MVFPLRPEDVSDEMLDGMAAEFDLALHRIHYKVQQMTEEAKTGPIPRDRIYRAIRKRLQFVEDLQQSTWV